jgi:hypothetical protein
VETVQHTSPEVIRLIDRELKRKKRRAKVKRLISAQIEWAVMNFMSAWMFMLAVGVAHAVWIPGLRTLGYWWALLLVYLLRAAFVPYKSSTKDGQS